MLDNELDNEVEDGEANVEVSEGSEVVKDAAEEGAFNKMKGQTVSRYYAEDNITVKCRNCKEYGHYARECPNEQKRDNCILCGMNTHDSFSCVTKLCFRCNNGGHNARDCKEQNISICPLCN
jgi:hypothetical protein